MSPVVFPSLSQWQMLRKAFLVIILIILSTEEKCGVSSFTPNQSITHRISTNLLASTSETSDAKPNGTSNASNIPFFATSLGGGTGSFFASTPASTKSVSSEGKAASITTRIPLGTLFDSRDYIFETMTNVRSVLRTKKVRFILFKFDIIYHTFC